VERSRFVEWFRRGPEAGTGCHLMILDSADAKSVAVGNSQSKHSLNQTGKPGEIPAKLILNPFT
jgi:hypothetical protein